MNMPSDYLERMAARMTGAFESMDALERGAIANPDEDRMVGHYWLRAPELAPSEEITTAIRETRDRVFEFAGGALRTPRSFAPITSVVREDRRRLLPHGTLRHDYGPGWTPKGLGFHLQREGAR